MVLQGILQSKYLVMVISSRIRDLLIVDEHVDRLKQGVGKQVDHADLVSGNKLGPILLPHLHNSAELHCGRNCEIRVILTSDNKLN